MTEIEFKDKPELNYATGKPEALATLKHVPEDFQVDEELGFAPTGAGEHVLLRVSKRNCSTTAVADRLSTALGISKRDVGYSGMKDRRALTTQWFSVRLPECDQNLLEEALPEGDPDLQLLECQRNQRKLRLGSHRHNRFRLALREVAGDRSALERGELSRGEVNRGEVIRSEVDSRLEKIAQLGFPNYYGSQRFGNGLSNLAQVQALFAREGAKGSRRSKRQGMLYSAARAWLFNQVLSERIAQGNWNRHVEGEVLNLDGSSRCFVDEDWDQTLADRLQTQDIHPTGPLCGAANPTDHYTPRAQVADIENAVLAKYPTLVEGLIRHGLRADRRALRCRVSDLQWQWQDGQTLHLHFRLPPGAYATSFLREICQFRAASASPETTGRQ